MATTIHNGQLVTSVAGQTEYNLFNPLQSGGTIGAVVMIELVSGSVKFSVGEDIDDNVYASYSTAGDKLVKTVSNVTQNSLRAKGAGTWRINW